MERPNSLPPAGVDPQVVAAEASRWTLADRTTIARRVDVTAASTLRTGDGHLISNGWVTVRGVIRRHVNHPEVNLAGRLRKDILETTGKVV